jgi:ATP-dependent Clp protease ATP-binding subunit ClpC
MFERYTDRARRVVVLAQEEARDLGHNYVGTEHILLGLIHEGTGVAARALTALGVSLDEIRAQVEAIIGRGDLAHVQNGPIPFTPRTKKVLELAAREARELGHSYIGTEHLLLGLMREGDGVGAQILNSAGIEFSAVRHQIRELLRGQQESYALPGEPLPGEPPAGEPPAGEPPTASPRRSHVWAAVDRRRAELGFDVPRGVARDIGSRLAAMDARLTVIEQRLRDTAPGAEAGPA